MFGKIQVSPTQHISCDREKTFIASVNCAPHGLAELGMHCQKRFLLIDLNTPGTRVFLGDCNRTMADPQNDCGGGG